MFLSNIGKAGFDSSNTFANSLGDNTELGYGSRSSVTNKLLASACATYAKYNTLIDTEMYQNKVRQILRGFEGDTARALQDACPDWATEMIGCDQLDKSHAPRLDREYERNLMHDFSLGLYKDTTVDEDSDEESEEEDEESRQILLALKNRREKSFILLMKYFPKLCSKTFYGHVQSKLQAQFPGGFKDGLKVHWVFLKNTVIEMCQTPNWISESIKLADEVSKLSTLTDVIAKVNTFQRWSSYIMTETHILSFMEHQVLGKEGMNEMRRNSIKVRELNTLDQWTNAIAALEPGAMSAINKALVINKDTHNRQPANRKRNKPGISNSGGGSAARASSTPVCRNFAKGNCTRGDTCYFSHVRAEPHVPNGKKTRKDSDGRRATGATRSLTSMAANGSSPSYRTPRRGGPVCYKCHETGHKAPDCTGEKCSCTTKGGRPASNCPKGKQSFAIETRDAPPGKSFTYSDSADPTGSIANEFGPTGPPLNWKVFPEDTAAIGQRPALKIRAEIHVAGADNLVPTKILLDTGANINLISESVAHHVTDSSPCTVQAHGHLQKLSTRGYAYLHHTDECGEEGLKRVQGYVVAPSQMASDVDILLGIHSIRDLSLDMNKILADGSATQWLSQYALAKAIPTPTGHSVSTRLDGLTPSKTTSSTVMQKIGENPHGVSISQGSVKKCVEDQKANSVVSSHSVVNEGQVDVSGFQQPRSRPGQTPKQHSHPELLQQLGAQTARGHDSNAYQAVSDELQPSRGLFSQHIELSWSEVQSKALLESDYHFNETFSYLDIRVDHDVPEELRVKVKKWAFEFRDIFSETELPKASAKFVELIGAHDMTKELKDNYKPYHAKARSYKTFEKKVLTRWTKARLKQGLFVPNPTSPWAVNVHMVDKSKGRPRFIFDRRGTNAQLVTRPAKMPDGTAETERASTRAKFRFHTDGHKSYLQLSVTQSSLDMNTVHTPLGKMADTRLAMGYAPAARIQQSYYTAAVQSMNEQAQSHTANFADDFAQWENDQTKFMQNLYAFGHMCREFGIALSPKKTSISGPTTRVKFYGSDILPYDELGGSTTKAKAVEALLNMQTPTSVKEVRSVLGLLNFSRLLVPNFANVLQPVSKLTKKTTGGKFEFPPEAQEALDKVIAILTSGVKRYKMNPTLHLHMDVDASQHGWGCHLFQFINIKGKKKAPQTIAWLSKQWPPSLRSRPAFVQEVHALFSALKAIRPWAFQQSGPVRVRTDAKSILWAHKQDTGPVAAYAAEAAAETPYVLEYIRGERNVVADALSRPPMVGPPVMTVYGLHTLVELLIGHFAASFSRCSTLWVHARTDTRSLEQLCRDKIPSADKFFKRQPSPENFSKVAADMAIFVPEAWKSPSLVRECLNADRNFAVLVPHDLIPEIAHDNDGTFMPHVAQRLSETTFVASASTMYTWVVYWPSAKTTHLVVMTAEVQAPVGLQVHTNGDFAQSEILNTLDVKDWIGHQTATVPARCPGEIVTRADGLKLYTDCSGLLRVVVPEHLRETLTTIVHQELQHLKDKFVLHRLRQRYWWPSMRSTVREVISKCAQCQLTNANRRNAHKDWHAPVVVAPRTKWHIDTKNFGKGRHALGCVDAFSGYAVLIPMEDRKAPTCANAFIDNIILVFGIPLEVRFDSAFADTFSKMLQRFGIKCSSTGAAHPTGNSAVERLWPLVTRHYMIADNDNLAQFTRGLRLVAWANNVHIREYGYTAFEVTFGATAITASDRRTYGIAGDTEHNASADKISQLIDNHDLTLEDCAAAGQYIRDSTAARLNARGRGKTVTFNIGDPVVIYRDPSGLTSDAYGRSRDYIPRWIGPGKISEILGSGMYKVTMQRFGNRPSTFLRNVALILPFTGEMPTLAPARDNQCSASIAATGKQCTATARPNGFCGRHQRHADSSITSTRVDDANRCTAIVTSSGQRCTATAKFNGKCGRHRNATSPTEGESNREATTTNGATPASI